MAPKVFLKTAKIEAQRGTVSHQSGGMPKRMIGTKPNNLQDYKSRFETMGMGSSASSRSLSGNAERYVEKAKALGEAGFGGARVPLVPDPAKTMEKMMDKFVNNKVERHMQGVAEREQAKLAKKEAAKKEKKKKGAKKKDKKKEKKKKKAKEKKKKKKAKSKKDKKKKKSSSSSSSSGSSSSSSSGDSGEKDEDKAGSAGADDTNSKKKEDSGSSADAESEEEPINAEKGQKRKHEDSGEEY